MKDTISVSGGKVSEDGVVESFDNDDEALDAFDNGVVVCNLTLELFGFALSFLFDQNLLYRLWTSHILGEFEVYPCLSAVLFDIEFVLICLAFRSEFAYEYYLKFVFFNLFSIKLVEMTVLISFITKPLQILKALMKDR